MIQSTMPANRKCFHDRDKNLKNKKNKNVQRKKKLQKLKHLADLYNECVKITEIHVPYRTHFTQTPGFVFLLFFFFKVFLALYPMEVFVCSKRW